MNGSRAMLSCGIALAVLLGGEAFPAQEPAFDLTAHRAIRTLGQAPPKPGPHAAPAIIRIAAAQGEFEPGGLTIRARRNLKNLRLTAGPPAFSKGNQLPASAIRIQRELPAKFQVGPKGKRHTLSVPEWLVPNDAQPFDLPKGKSATFWITVHVPLNAQAGRYVGHVEIRADGLAPRHVPLELDVRPFKLAAPSVSFAMLYTYEFRYLERYDPQYQPARKRRPAKDRAAFLKRGRAVVRDMAEHGMTAIFPHSSRVLLRKDGQLVLPDWTMSLKTARAFGMTGPPGWFVGWLVNAQWADTPKFNAERDGRLLKEIIARAGQIAKAEGFKRFIILPSDEPKVSVPRKLNVARKLLKAAFQTAEDSGARLAVSSNYETFKELTGIHHLSLFDGGTPEQWAAMRKAGKQVWIYDNHSTTGHHPAWSRLLYGFLGWRAGFDGIASWTYPLYIGSWGNRKRKDAEGRAVPTYDAQGRPINTLVWEGIREGTDDRRYLDTLRQEIAVARRKGLKAEADEAQKVLDELHAAISPKLSDYGYIQTERGAPSPGKIGPAWMDAARERLAGAIVRLRAKGVDAH